MLGGSALHRVWRVACPDRDTVSARTAPETALDDRPRLERGRTRAVPSACLPVLPRWTGPHADGVGLVVPSPHPIPCCRGRGTGSTVWCVSAGRTPVFPDWFQRLGYRIFDSERTKSCGCIAKRTRFTPAVNGGILSLNQDRDEHRDRNRLFCNRVRHPLWEPLDELEEALFILVRTKPRSEPLAEQFDRDN